MARALSQPMAAWLRILLWVVVALVPGGLLLLPVLIRDELRRRRRPPSAAIQPAPNEAFAATTLDPA